MPNSAYRQVFVRVIAPAAGAIALMMSLAACDSLRMFEGQNEAEIPAEPSMPADEEAAGPPPVKPMAPLPARKPQPPAPLPPPPPPLPSSLAVVDGVPMVVGLNRDGLIRQFGMPEAEREAPPARVLEFGDGDCRLAAYLYFDTARNDFYALQYEVNGMVERTPASNQCLVRIARDATLR